MVLRPEDFEARFATLTAGLDNLAIEALGDDRADNDGPVVSAHSAVRQALRAYLADEIVPAVELEGDTGIRVTEAQHEQVKRALTHLKLGVLRDIARQRGVDASGDLDLLTGRIGKALDWDRELVARLILDHTEEDPEVATGHSTRVFALRGDLSVDEVERRLIYVSGRYIKTGIARWFIFEDSRVVPPLLRVEGAVEAFRAEARELGDSPYLDSTPTRAEVEIELSSESNVALVHGASAHNARCSLTALNTAAKVDHADFVPRAELNAGVFPRRIHPTSFFMLDLVYSRLRGSLFRERNPILARFRFSRSDEEEQDQSVSRKPRLRAVRFDGEHLLDSREACSLLWLEGRPLVDLTVRVRARGDGDEDWGRFPVRITIETDHVAVSTGYGSGSLDRSQLVHRASVAAVQSALIGSEPDWDRLSAVERHIEKVATSETPPETAELLADLENEQVKPDVQIN